MSTVAANQVATLEQFIAGWKKFTPEDWMASWSEDCTQKMLPFTMGVPARPRDEVQVVLPKLMEILTNYEAGSMQVLSISLGLKNLSF